MKKTLLSLAVAVAVLTACAGRQTPSASSSTPPAATPSSSGSNLEFYGITDTGIGSQKVWH